MKLEKNDRKAPKRTGGSRARHAERKNHAIKPYLGALNRPEKCANLIDDVTLQSVEDCALSVLENLGVDFGCDDGVIALLINAGAEYREGRIHFPKGLCQRLIKQAPQSFTHHARNPEYSLEIGGHSSVFIPALGASFVRDLDGKRRQSTQNDLNNFVKLAHLSPGIHATGFTPCQALDIERNERYLDALYAHVKFSDKPFNGSVGSAVEAAHSIEFAKIVFGEAFSTDHQVVMADLNVRSPLKFDQNTLDVLQVYAASNQAMTISSMALLGITCPMSLLGALVQVTAEFLAGAALTQVIKPGAPVVFGIFSAVASMQSGKLSFSSPEGVQFIQCAGQIAHKLGVPFRASGGVTSSKNTDTQAAYESTNGLNASISGGVNVISNSAGALEGGLTVSYEKFIGDSDQLAFLQKRGSLSEDRLSENIEDVISGGINLGGFLGSAHTKDNFKEFDNGSDLSDNNIYEQWIADGEKTFEERAVETCKAWLENYQEPPIDQDIDKALIAFIEAKKRLSSELPKTNKNSFLEADCQAIAANHLHDNMWGDVFRRFQC